jgi:hypothetical protein
MHNLGTLPMTSGTHPCVHLKLVQFGGYGSFASLLVRNLVPVEEHRDPYEVWGCYHSCSSFDNEPSGCAYIIPGIILCQAQLLTISPHHLGLTQRERLFILVFAYNHLILDS